VVRAFAPDGAEIVYQGANDPHVPITQGWLRASHRALDTEQSRPFLPVHRHDRAEPLTPAPSRKGPGAAMVGVWRFPSADQAS
jgi:uncharacterized protein